MVTGAVVTTTTPAGDPTMATVTIHGTGLIPTGPIITMVTMANLTAAITTVTGVTGITTNPHAKIHIMVVAATGVTRAGRSNNAKIMTAAVTGIITGAEAR